MKKRDDENIIKEMILTRKTTKVIIGATGASKATISRIRHSIPECQLSSSVRQYEVDKNIPLTPKKPAIHRSSKYPWDEMEVGDSFLVRFGDKKQRGRSKALLSVLSCIGKKGASTAIPRGPWRRG